MGSIPITRSIFPGGPAVIDPRIEQEARRHYDPELPYHNFGHVQRTLADAERLLARYREQGIPVDEDVVRYALLFHDAGYREDHSALGYPSKEAYSAAIAREHLGRHGMPESFIEQVERAILATEHQARGETLEERIVRAADLYQLAADYEVFRENSERLRREAALLTGREQGDGEWRERVERIVGSYAAEDLDLGPWFRDRGTGDSFPELIRENLRRYLEELDGG
ncbi:MAG: HD domain-containing protein [Gammaproteobacteria bacterium]|nr:MAG: HD domain-containing protein [Gammaproteobacteria bacterium]